MTNSFRIILTLSLILSFSITNFIIYPNLIYTKSSAKKEKSKQDKKVIKEKKTDKKKSSTKDKSKDKKKKKKKNESDKNEIYKEFEEEDKYSNLEILELDFKGIRPSKGVPLDTIYDPVERKKQEIERSIYHESPFRRAEIIFFIAFPFLYAWNSIMHTQISVQQPINGQPKGMITDQQFFYMLSSSLMLGLLIAWDDYENVYIDKNPSPIDNFLRQEEHYVPNAGISVVLFYHSF